jgi:uncharacterized repeat protein (TIGR01451 family)
MSIRTSFGLRTALVAVAAIGWWTGANAQSLTPANTAITNRATVNYSVGGQAQALIESSPLGNTTPGFNNGVNTSFVVDNLVDFTVSEVSGDATVTTPGLPAVLAFTVTNTGNAPQGYALSFLEEVATGLFTRTDNVDIGNLIIRVDEDPSAGTGDGDGIYNGSETATAIDVLNQNEDIRVFIVSPAAPLTLLNLNVANVRLQAQAADAGTNGATLTTESAGANGLNTVEILFGDLGGDATESSVDQFFVQSAALTITKAPTVLDDGFGSASPRAVPGATVEYTITVTNTSTTTAADAVSVSDPVPANTTFLAAQYGGQDVRVSNGAVVTFCTADAADADADGCGIASGALSVAASAIGSIPASTTATVRFQVTIN